MPSVTAKATPLGARWSFCKVPPPVQKPAFRGLTRGNGVDLTHAPIKLPTAYLSLPANTVQSGSPYRGRQRGEWPHGLVIFGSFHFGYIYSDNITDLMMFTTVSTGPKFGAELLQSAGTDLTTAEPASRWDPAGTGVWQLERPVVAKWNPISEN